MRVIKPSSKRSSRTEKERFKTRLKKQNQKKKQKKIVIQSKMRNLNGKKNVCVLSK